jgi:hypothetical protein
MTRRLPRKGSSRREPIRRAYRQRPLSPQPTYQTGGWRTTPRCRGRRRTILAYRSLRCCNRFERDPCPSTKAGARLERPAFERSAVARGVRCPASLSLSQFPVSCCRRVCCTSACGNEAKHDPRLDRRVRDMQTIWMQSVAGPTPDNIGEKVPAYAAFRPPIGT